MMNETMTRNIDMPANLFSNLGGSYNVVKQNNELANDMKDYYESGDIKLTKTTNQMDYRERLNKMYDDLKEIKPIDCEVENKLDTKNYIEKGIVVKPTTQELKQFWTEYRLVNNENKTETKKEVEKKNDMDDYDKIFESLSSKINEINNYIKDLKELKKKIDKEREQLEKDKREFQSYKDKEIKNIELEKNKISSNYSKLQTIINSLDETLTEVE